MSLLKGALDFRFEYDFGSESCGEGSRFSYELSAPPGAHTSPFDAPPPLQAAVGFYCHFSASGNASALRVEDVVLIATGHEREELEAELQDILEINHPWGPFGTKESPAVIKSYYDKRIVGCPGGEGEDEHDVVWFWLEKGIPHECPVCSQYFTLEVVDLQTDMETEMMKVITTK
ncbi:cytochrome c oxidase subunit 5b-1, mitochondrial-like [Salvia divinorum]|uniref:Cytochrome c oxidase subunit 5b-1, mitochondrial-like n=1 Tax=Salvia divinorum TaxID=28513 RepID=A0ABD1I8G4_SALDI